jgi:hypothetical protein
MASFAQVNILIGLIYNGAATKKGTDEINLIIALLALSGFLFNSVLIARTKKGILLRNLPG